MHILLGFASGSVKSHVAFSINLVLSMVWGATDVYQVVKRTLKVA